ncbi:MAG: response regulator [Clostridiales Family XIII bacterium]|jgi:putative two-component system response regulator|nr:response regulator [Clostridiales Family XIII bacterium]
MKRILVVDDNISNLKQIGALLAKDYKVSLATSEEQAISMSMRKKPDLILLDLDMHGAGGLDAMAALKLNPLMRRIPVIFMVDGGAAGDEARLRTAGAADLVARPVEPETFRHKIELNIRCACFKATLEDEPAYLYDGNAISLAERIEGRDANTEGHAARTGKYVGMLGRKLIESGVFEGGLTDADVEMIERAAPLHDIGKIAISDGILLKPGKLNCKEFALMKRHAAIGAEVLGNMYAQAPAQHYLQFARIIAGSHHERYDGNGYPCGLVGDNIPICGRIMAVADVYDSLIGNRVYKKGVDHAEACEIIVGEKGRQFDPHVVDAFISIKDFMGEISSSTNVTAAAARFAAL